MYYFLIVMVVSDRLDQVLYLWAC